MNEHKIIEVENEKSESEDNLIIESVNKFLEKDVKPYVKEFESQDKYPEEIADKMAELGLFGATISPEYGLKGQDIRDYVFHCARIDESARHRHHLSAIGILWM